MKIKCKIVTPLLMHGNDGNDGKTPELRAQSFKGIMRFWWRAINGNLSLEEELKKKEAEIFGDTSRKSSFRIKILNKNIKKGSFAPLPHREKSFKVNGFNPNQIFEIEFLGKNLELAKNIFLLSTILGGFGQRARRGFGSLEIVQIDNKEFCFEKTKENIVNLIEKINQEFSFDDKNFASNRKYPYIKSIEIGKNYNDYNKLLKQIGLATHKYPCFGKAKPRQASPVIISILQYNTQYNPILTTLYGKGCCWKNINDFKGMIL